MIVLRCVCVCVCVLRISNGEMNVLALLNNFTLAECAGVVECRTNYLKSPTLGDRGI